MYLYAFISVILVSALSLLGALTLLIQERVLRSYIFLLVSLAVGALLGDAFLHLIPEAFKNTDSPVKVSLAIIGGILLFFMLEKFLHWHHHAVGDDKHMEEHRTAGRLIILSDSMHNFIDGLIIGTSYLISIPVGIATTTAVIFHEIPQEIGHFGVLLHVGYSKGRALWLNFLSALVAIAGTIIALTLGDVSSSVALWGAPLAAGGFIYVALADLVPSLHEVNSTRDSLLQIAVLIAGVAIMAGLLVVG